MCTCRTTGFARLVCFALLSIWAMIIPYRGVSASAKATFLEITSREEAGFTRVEASKAGIHFANLCPASRSITNQIYLNGSGLAAGDVDGDGWCDLFFAGLENQSALYRNLGNWQFKDITQEAGLTNVVRDATGVALVDIDGDGDLDLIVNSVGNGTWIYLNDGKGRFTPSDQVLNQRQGGTSLALADVDGDGDLDLYVANYRASTIRDQPNTRFSIRTVNGKPQVGAVDGRPASDPDLQHRFDYSVAMDAGSGNFNLQENGEPDALYLNDGRGHFT